MGEQDERAASTAERQAGAVASHASAGALYGLVDPPVLPEVSVGRTASGRFGGARVHHATVGWADRCRVNGLPGTRIARTIVDCAAGLDQESLNGLIDAAIGRGLTTLQRIRSAWERAGAVKGGSLLTEALASYSGGAPPRSVKEAHLRGGSSPWSTTATSSIRLGRGRPTTNARAGSRTWAGGWNGPTASTSVPQRHACGPS